MLIAAHLNNQITEVRPQHYTVRDNLETSLMLIITVIKTGHINVKYTNIKDH